MNKSCPLPFGFVVLIVLFLALLALAPCLYRAENAFYQQQWSSYAEGGVLFLTVDYDTVLHHYVCCVENRRGERRVVHINAYNPTGSTNVQLPLKGEWWEVSLIWGNSVVAQRRLS
jgi:hypothetical protein